MPSSLPFLTLLQQVTLPDTLITRVVPERGVFEYASGILEVVVLFLAAIALATFVWSFISLQRVASHAERTLRTLVDDARPILKHATAAASDARETIAQLRADVEKVTDAAAEVSGQLLEGAEVTAQRIDEVNAVLDVLQDELERTAISSVAAVRGMRVGVAEMASALGGGSRKARSKRSARGASRTRHRESDFDSETD